MVAQIGRKVILEVGAVGVSPLVAIPGVREKNVACSGEPIDITSDEDTGWRLLLDEAAQNEVNVSISGVAKDDSLFLEWAAGTRTMSVRMVWPNTGLEMTGTFFLSSYSRNDPYNDAVTFDAELVSSGLVTFTPASP